MSQACGSADGVRVHLRVLTTAVETISLPRYN